MSRSAAGVDFRADQCVIRLARLQDFPTVRFKRARGPNQIAVPENDRLARAGPPPSGSECDEPHAETARPRATERTCPPSRRRAKADSRPSCSRSFCTLPGPSCPRSRSGHPTGTAPLSSICPVDFSSDRSLRISPPRKRQRGASEMPSADDRPKRDVFLFSPDRFISFADHPRGDEERISADERRMVV